MIHKNIFLIILLLLALGNLTTRAEEKVEDIAFVSTIDPEELVEFDSVPDHVQELIVAALELTEENLFYKYGGATVEQGGMDCSGCLYYLLRSLGVNDIPRQSNYQYKWIWEHSDFQAVNGRSFKSFEFKNIQPGDMLFWTGTYDVGDRDPPVSHSMIYLGKNKSGQRLMFGASKGRTYKGVSQNGVSVFDFRLPRNGSKSRFIGYGPIPKLKDALSSQDDEKTAQSDNPS